MTGKYLVVLSALLTFFAFPATLGVHPGIVNASASGAATEVMTPPHDSEGIKSRQSFRFVEVDLCYFGQAPDPATGDTIDLFDLCTSDTIGGNLDLA